MNLDWRRLKAVVLESDDWGLCAWSPDEQAYRVLADTPAFRTPAGRRYGASTLESAADVRSLVETLLEFRGGDGFPPVWQANTVLAAPDYPRLRAPSFEAPLPLVDFPTTPSRWQRPGLWEETARAVEAGTWWPELHGLHHLAETAWLGALRRGVDDARRAFEHQSFVCQVVEASGEYHPAEPPEVRTRNLTLAVAKFVALTGRAPRSLCPPDYRWDERLEVDAERLGVSTLQGKAEQIGPSLPKIRRLVMRYRWPHRRGARFYMPPRIAFEPRPDDPAANRVGAAAVRRAARSAWQRGQPAAVSTHRVNYAHLDPRAAAGGRSALRDLLSGFIEDGAVFLIDDEVRQLQEWSWSVRPIGDRGALLRYYGVPNDPIRFAAPAGTYGVTIRDGHGAQGAEVAVEEGEVVARMNVGEYLLEWNVSDR